MTDQLLAAIGGRDECLQGFTDDNQGDATANALSDADAQTMQLLRTVYRDARALAVAQGGYVTKSTSLNKLLSELRQLESDLVFAVGTGPAAARDTDPGRIVVDRRTNRSKLVLYAESDSGVVWRLTTQGTTGMTFARAATGVRKLPKPQTPQPPTPPTYTIDAVLPADPATVYVTATLTYEGQKAGALLKVSFDGTAWKVGDLYVSALSAATGTASGGP